MKTVRILAALALLALLAGCGAEPPAVQESGGTITAYPEALNLDPGAQEVLQVRLDPARLEEQGAVFTSSDPDVATVAEDGTVTALASGVCTVTAAARADGAISCRVEVTVGDGRDAEELGYVAYVDETNAASVYPTYYLSETEVSAMTAEELRFTINQIYAKNGYVFKAADIQEYFSRMPWYVPVSGDTARLQMSPVDRSNLNLLVRYREDAGAQEKTALSSVGWMWTRYAVDEPLDETYVRNLSDYDIQLLINTIYAKNGYVFGDADVQAMFEDQPWYEGSVTDSRELSFSELDSENLALLLDCR